MMAAPTAAANGTVTTHATTILPMLIQSTALGPASSTPMASTDPIWQCVLLTGAPKNEASRTLSVDPSSMAKPRVKLTFVMSEPHGLDNLRVIRAERLAAYNAIQVSAGGRSRTSGCRRRCMRWRTTSSTG